MSFNKSFIKRFTFLLLLSLSIVGCKDDLTPSSDDIRSESEKTGGLVAQSFTVVDTEDNEIILEDELLVHDAVVLYFNMWCPTCDSHMTHLRNHIIPNYPSSRFIIVDYVSGSTSQSRAAQLANGYAALTVVADVNHQLFNQFDAAMGRTVVIDSQSIIRLNENYKNGTKLNDTLAAL